MNYKYEDNLQTQRLTTRFLTLDDFKTWAKFMGDQESVEFFPKANFKTVFEPGFTTKARGWGLGLSLCKRIIEDYHGGKIFVKGSELNKGTTFRIVLNKRS